MSVAAPAFVLASGVQGGHVPASGHETLPIVLAIAAMAAVSVLIYLYLRRRYRPKPVTDHWQALAVMGELCPHGWQAQINLYGWGAPVPEDAPASRVPLVLDPRRTHAEPPPSHASPSPLWSSLGGSGRQRIVTAGASQDMSKTNGQQCARERSGEVDPEMREVAEDHVGAEGACGVHRGA